MHNFCLSDAILERYHDVENEMGFSEQIIKLDCDILDTWEFRDRKPFEMGAIEDLAQSIKTGGQCQPIVVVKASEEFKPRENLLAHYVIISGYRRWLACKKNNMKVQAIIRNISFDQAITIWVSENEKETLSDYSKGMFYYSLLTKEKLSLDQLSKKLNISTSHMNLFLTFAKIPSQIWVAVGDLSKVTAKAAAMIHSIASKGPIYVKALIAIADKIARGYGEKRIQKAVDAIIDKPKSTSKEHVIDHKIKFDGKIIINLHQGRIKLDDSLVNHGNYDDLIATLEKEIIDFANVHLKRK